MKRRDFLNVAARTAMGAYFGMLPGFASGAAPAGAASSGAATAGAPVKRLIVLFLRGGLDGLSSVVPVDDRWYYQARPTIALAPPGREGGTLPLTPGFGLHPALEPLLEFWRAGSLSLIPACGLPVPMRSHPEAQRAMESGQPTERHNRDGWLARMLPLLGPQAKALALAPTPPLISQGRPGIQNVRPTGFPPSVWRIERPAIFSSFDAIYQGNDPLSRSYRQSQTVLRNKLTELDREISVSSAGAPSIHALPTLGAQITAYIGKNPDVRLVYAALGGLDAHFEQGAEKGRLAEALLSLGKGLASLGKALGPTLNDTCVLVMSEFGRSLRENEFGGTDNGHGTLFMVLGGRTAGGALHGPWPGLAPEKLSDGLDLGAGVDFREVIAQIAASHFGLGREAVAQVVPAYTPSGALASLFRSSGP
ncbi:MAG: DUF1501 domain-containing protein [Acidobacteriota bacterium]